MEKVKLYDSELKLMELLWNEPGLSAKALSVLAREKIGWNKNTTYTIITKLVDKGVIQRVEPGFVCMPLVTKEQVQYEEARELLDKLFDGSTKTLFASFLAGKKLSRLEVDELHQLIDSYSEDGE